MSADVVVAGGDPLIANVFGVRRDPIFPFSLPETIAMEVTGSIFAVSRTRCR